MTSLRTVPREFAEVPLHLIDEPTLPARSDMPESTLDDLAASIRDLGLQQPMIVARVGVRYEVVAGHRRRVACGRAGLISAPCLIYPSKDDALLSVQFAENYAREELSAADEAIWFEELLDRVCGGDVDVLCARLNSSRNYVEGRLLLFRGDPVVFAALQREDIKIGVAHELNKVGDERTRRYFLDAACRGGATQGVVQGWVHQWKIESGAAVGAPAPVFVADSCGPVPEMNYFTCACCGKTDNVHLMRPINVHDYCRLAILDRLLAAYRGELA
mgnify:CR=1 FL=1